MIGCSKFLTNQNSLKLCSVNFTIKNLLTIGCRDCDPIKIILPCALFELSDLLTFLSIQSDCLKLAWHKINVKSWVQMISTFANLVNNLCVSIDRVGDSKKPCFTHYTVWEKLQSIKKHKECLILAFQTILHTGSSVTRKNCQMSIKVAQNDFTRKIKDFDTFTKIA